MKNQFLNYANEVLKEAEQPLTFQEIWDAGVKMELNKKLESSGKTPWSTLGARLFVDVRDNSNSSFIKVGSRPARFFLKARENEIDEKLIIKKEEEKEKSEQSQFSFLHERDLHPVLTYFAYSNPGFNKGKSILTKTIIHEQSEKKGGGYNQWVFPDLVGFYFPIEDWEKEVIELNGVTDQRALVLYSFEMKKSLTRGNYRESFFQAVSNSSWANEGYLVAASITRDEYLLTELQRLSQSFGIGIIQLNLSDDIDSSEVLFSATLRNQLDWETINKLCSLNKNFKSFLENIKIDLGANRIHNSEYDPIKEDIIGHINKIMKKND